VKYFHIKLLPALAVLFLDQISKIAVISNIDLYNSIPVIDGFFSLAHMRNRGMAFGIMNQSTISWKFYLLVIATLVAIGVLVYWLVRLKQEEKKTMFSLSLILGGALGNLVDRIRIQEVIDFLDFSFMGHHWPAFNLADSAISIGVILILIYMLFQKPPDSPDNNTEANRNLDTTIN